VEIRCFRIGRGGVAGAGGGRGHMKNLECRPGPNRSENSGGSERIGPRAAERRDF